MELGSKPLPGVLALKKTQEIVIFRCSSVFYFDPVSHEVEETANCIDHAGIIFSNQVRQAEDGGIYLLKYKEFKSGPKLLKWTRGEQKVALIKDYPWQSDK